MTTDTATILTARDYRVLARTRLVGAKGMSTEEQIENLTNVVSLLESALTLMDGHVGPHDDTIKEQTGARAYRKEAHRLLFGRKGLSAEDQIKRVRLAYNNVAAAIVALDTPVAVEA